MLRLAISSTFIHAQRAVNKALSILLSALIGLGVALAILGSASHDNVQIPPGAAGQYADVAGLKIRYLQQGQGQDLVLIHGSPGSLEVWKPTIERLATRYRVTAFDRPAQGFSSAPSTPVGIRYNAKIARALIDRLGLYEPLIVGHSYGGAVALAVALDGAPVRGVVVVASTLYPARRPTALSRTLRVPLVGRGLAVLLSQVGGNLVQHGLAEAFHPDEAMIPPGFAAQMAQIWLQPKVLVAAAQELGQHADEVAALSARYSTMSKPVFILAGDADKPAVVQGARKFAHDVPTAKLTVLEHAGHMLQFTRTDAFDEQVDNAAQAAR